MALQIQFLVLWKLLISVLALPNASSTNLPMSIVSACANWLSADCIAVSMRSERPSLDARVSVPLHAHTTCACVTAVAHALQRILLRGIHCDMIYLNLAMLTLKCKVSRSPTNNECWYWPTCIHCRRSTAWPSQEHPYLLWSYFPVSCWWGWLAIPVFENNPGRRQDRCRSHKCRCKLGQAQGRACWVSKWRKVQHRGGSSQIWIRTLHPCSTCCRGKSKKMPWSVRHREEAEVHKGIRGCTSAGPIAAAHLYLDQLLQSGSLVADRQETRQEYLARWLARRKKCLVASYGSSMRCFLMCR